MPAARPPFQLFSSSGPRTSSAEARRLVSWELEGQASSIIRSWDGYAPTPLVALPGLAATAGVGQVLCKHEGGRFGIGSLKALGGAYAVFHALDARRSEGAQAGDLTFVTASDGNHGLSVAWGARRVGARCVVFLHHKVSAGRARLIADMGARIVRIEGTYDDSTDAAAAAAAKEGWILVADTSTLSYDELPVRVMAGYGLMVEELAAQLTAQTAPTHVFIQGGCGGLAAAVCGLVRERWPFPQPTIVVVEPELAPCLYESARAGAMVRVEGDLDTLMGGLSVGEPSAVAWPVLQEGADHFMTIPDAAAARLIRALAKGAHGDAPVAIGDSGVAGLAGLLALAPDPAARAAVGLDGDSRVLCIATEGPVDRETYEAIVAGETEGRAAP